MNQKMSRIERLIAEKCPEGVEYRALLETPSHPKNIVLHSTLTVKDFIAVCITNLSQNRAKSSL